ncbi:tetratricopeptide repeat protein [Saccharothrix longispora]|uniref:Tetratricopeptide (TPR) repeat protein n=1 Tax=Saccharothrix longispora TaxID=33920 RepID=A0ABU1Q6P1_9PSEU|nr:tetratricopeptide repeat protein [Saccharothrix longispora]MDR6598567.1 tetratricopeptide (TPR) repeat protein [Saccharothrix longispora]
MDRTLSPGELLDPRHEVVPFLGRAGEVAALTRWRDAGGARSVLLLHGPAGVGKTRLAARVGGVRVVDDADLVPWRDLHDLLLEGGERVLLVARATGWWWSAVRQRAADLGYAAEELALAAGAEPHDFGTVCAYVANALGLPAPDAATTSRVTSSGVVPPGATFHDLHVAAVAAAHGAVPDDDPAELVRRVMSADPAPPRGRFAEDVLAVALLDDRIAPEPTADALEVLMRAAGRWPHVLRRADELFTADPGLAATASAAALRVLVELGSPASARAVARHVFHDARFHRDPLPALLTRALLEDAAPVVGTVELAELHGALAARAALAGLREEAVGASRREVVLYRRAAGDDPEHRLSLADALGDLGLRLVAVGRAGEALEVAREAVRLLRVVVAGDDDHVPRLAVALDRLGLRHASLGDGEEALAAVAEAAARYGELVKRDPALFGPEQAKVTHHHAVRLLDVGRREEAVRTARLAVARWREVAEGDPRFEAESARALRSVASLLAHTDDLAGADEALGVVQESISLLRRLARANPADFEPELASALGEASALLRRRGRFAEALAASGEAVLLRRRAARDADPDAVARLASALAEQADVLREPERSAAAEEAADLLRPLAARLPAHRVAFAAALARVARVLLDADRDHEARRVVDEVTAIDLRLPRPLLVARGPGLASALHALAGALADHRHGERARRVAEREAGVWRELLGHHRAAPAAYAAAVHRAAGYATGDDGLHRARGAVLVWHLTRTPEELALDVGYAEALSRYARRCVAAGAEVDRALLPAHRAVVVLRAAGVPREVLLRAVEVVDDVVRAHADPEAARARLRDEVGRVSPW